MGNASASLAACVKAIDAGESELVLDGLAHSDSSAVAVLLAALRHAEGAGRPFRVSGMPDSVRSLATLYGVEGLMGSVPVPLPAPTAA
jgi:phospholipid transport system transporter-binding protein